MTVMRAGPRTLDVALRVAVGGFALALVIYSVLRILTDLRL